MTDPSFAKYGYFIMHQFKLRRTRISVLLGACALCVLSVLASATQPQLLDAQPLTPPSSYNVMHRLQLYCNNPPLKFRDEGVAPIAGAVLRQVHIFFRHGDRSAIHSLPNVTVAQKNGKDVDRWPCTAPSTHEVKWASTVLSPLRSNAACITDGKCRELGHTARTATAFEIWAKARNEGEGCGSEPGQLSSIGWRQLQGIGSAAGRVYYDLLASNNPTSDALRVISTDTGRTILSATAFVRGLLHGYNEKADVCLRVTEGVSELGGYDSQHMRHDQSSCADLDHRTAQMPQLSLPIPLHVVARAEDPVMFGNLPQSCQRAMAFEDAHHEQVWRYEKLPSDVASRIAGIMELSTADQQHAADVLPGVEETVDALYAGLCHGHALPCWNIPGKAGAAADNITEHDKPNGITLEDVRIHAMSKALFRNSAVGTSDRCLSPSDASLLFQHADDHYANRFAQPSTRWLLVPIFQQVLKQARSLADNTRHAPRMVLRAAHDTVIAPLLTVLGLHPRAYTWPGYASRVALEVWEPPAAESVQNWIIQVVYNGVAVPLPFGQHGTATVGQLTEFVESLTEAVNWNEFCKVD